METTTKQQTETKLTDEQIRVLERELTSEVDMWIDRTFNNIHVEAIKAVITTEHQSELFEYIRDIEPDYMEFLNNYSLTEEYYNYVARKELQLNDESLQEFCEEHSSFDDWRAERSTENYPMWNICFEFKHSESEEVLQAAQNAGFGIIEGVDYFNDILFVAGCGYSFMSAHWIPMYLNLPWNADKKEKYKDIKIDHL